MAARDMFERLSALTGHSFGPLDALAAGAMSQPTGPWAGIGGQMQDIIANNPSAASVNASGSAAGEAGIRVDEQTARLSDAQAALEAAGQMGEAAMPKPKMGASILAGVSDALYELGRGIDTPRSNFSGNIAQQASQNADRANRRAEMEAQSELMRAGQIYGSESEAALQERQIATDEGQAALERGHETAERFGSQDWRTGERVGSERAAVEMSELEHTQQMEAMGFDRDTQVILTTMGLDHETQTQIAQHTFEASQRDLEASDAMARLREKGEIDLGMLNLTGEQQQQIQELIGRQAMGRLEVQGEQAVEQIGLQGEQETEIQKLIGRQAMGQIVEKGYIDMNLLDRDGQIRVALLTQEGSQAMDQIHEQISGEIRVEGQKFSNEMNRMAIMDAKSLGFKPEEGFMDLPWKDKAQLVYEHAAGEFDQWYQGRAPEDLAAREARGEPYLAKAVETMEAFRADPTGGDLDTFGAQMSTTLRMLDRYLPDEALKIRLRMEDLMPDLSERYYKKNDPRGFFGSMYTGMLMMGGTAGAVKGIERIQRGKTYETGEAEGAADLAAQSWMDEFIY